MSTWRACFAIGVVLAIGVGLFAEAPDKLVSRQRLDELSAALENDETRMSAVRELIEFAGDQRYMRGSVRGGSGDPEKDRLMWEAGDVLLRCVDVETIGKALSDPDRNVHELRRP